MKKLKMKLAVMGQLAPSSQMKHELYHPSLWEKLDRTFSIHLFSNCKVC